MSKEIVDLLGKMNAPEVFLDIASGASYPPLTDHYLQAMPPTGADPPPRDLADGRDLVPVFSSADWYAVYCVDRNTLEIFQLDIENPWPPNIRFSSWISLAESLIRILEENDPESVTDFKKRLFGG